jgi:general secretion pathway protein J
MSDRRAGFTLLEVVIALALFGLLLAALGQGLRFGLKTWDLQAAAAGRSDALLATDRGLRRLIEAMEPENSASPLSAVDGRADRLSFVTRFPAALGWDRRVDAVLTLGSGGRLVLRWHPHRHEISFASPAADTETVLLDGVERLALAYWRPAAPGIAGGWVDSWNQPGLPALVRVRLSFGKGDPRHWPDLVAAPLIDARTN